MYFAVFYLKCLRFMNCPIISGDMDIDLDLDLVLDLNVDVDVDVDIVIVIDKDANISGLFIGSAGLDTD